jgi:hypothetical protein
MKRTLKALGLVGLFVLSAITAQVGVEGAKAAFWNWSKTASSNGNSDPSINWIEGMPPSVVNDSARAMMARLAEQFADTSGSLVTSGGPTAYTVTTTQGFPNPPNDGMTIGVTFNVASSGSPTLAVDGGAATPVVNSIGVAANITASVPYVLLYNAANTSWLVRSGGATGIVPVGGLIPYTGTVVPNANYVFANGQCISTTTYAVYWALIGSPAPGSCSAGNFAVIDLRGRALAGLDNMGGATAAGRMTSAASGCGTAMTSVGAVCTNGNESQFLSLAQLPTGITSANTASIALNVTSTSTLPNSSGSFTGGGAIVGPTAYNANVASSGTIAIGNAAVTSNNTSGNAHSTVQPTIGINYIIRVL